MENPDETAHVGEEDDNVVTMSEVIEGLEAQELEAELVLGGDEGKDCTYPKGYLPRQAVFSCITCCPEGNAGVCTACSIACHDGHEVIELWTRRRFRCDCGNSKFGIGVCRKFSSKDSENTENLYNQNFKGVYCICKRPYPDPDGENHGEMLQCCICEDWFHEAHLGLAPEEEVPRDDDGEPLFDELICQACAASLSFLCYYNELVLSVVPATKDGASKEAVNAHNVSSSANVSMSTNSQAGNEKAVVVDASQVLQELGPNNSSKLSLSDKYSDGNGKALNGVSHLDNGSPSSTVQTIVADGNSANASVCTLNIRKGSGVSKGIDPVLGNQEVAASKALTGKAIFLVKNWRVHLCRCNECQTMYQEKGVSFLLDSEDTLGKYEETAKQKHKEKLEAENGRDLSFLNNLGHVGQIEFLHKLNDMASEFTSHFASFGDSGRTITSADIHEFFDNLKRKKTRLA